MPKKADKQNILVIKLSALGDFVQALGPMAAIRKHHPDANITLLTTKPFAKFGEECGYFDEIWIDEKPRWHSPLKWLSLKKRLNSANIDRVYDLQNNDRTSLYFKLFNSKNKPEWVGVAKGASHRNISASRTSADALSGHIETLALAGIKGIKIDDMKWVKTDTEHLDVKTPYALLVPGSSPEHPQKRWPAEKYAELAGHLHSRGCNPLIIGTKEENHLAEEICQICPEASDLTGKTSLFDIAVLARNAEYAIGNDTGPMHLIAPTGCNTIVLFSRHSNPVRHAPQGAKLQTIQCDDLEQLEAKEVLSRLR
jgi:ADP-heptose:LPS heptosyltransferase